MLGNGEPGFRLMGVESYCFCFFFQSRKALKTLEELGGCCVLAVLAALVKVFQERTGCRKGWYRTQQADMKVDGESPKCGALRKGKPKRSQIRAGTEAARRGFESKRRKPCPFGNMTKSTRRCGLHGYFRDETGRRRGGGWGVEEAQLEWGGRGQGAEGRKAEKVSNFENYS